MKRHFAPGLAVLACGGAGATNFEFLPPSPIAGEPFAIVGLLRAGALVGAVTTMQATTIGDEIQVRDFTGAGFAGPPESSRFGALVSGLPAGRYYADIRTAHGVVGTTGVLTVRPEQAVAAARRDVTGNWFDPAEPGWGLNIVQGASGKLLIAWMAYRPSDEPEKGFSSPSFWMIAPDGRWITESKWRGVAFLSRYVGHAAADDPAMLQATPLGYVEVEFTGASVASFAGRFLMEHRTEQMTEKRAVLRRFDF